ncbi:MAG: toll/interleukin-1 receptor domain-containing protein [Hyphomicrobiaceae bacterium]
MQSAPAVKPDTVSPSKDKTAPPAERLRVFMSYARADTAFADEIVNGLEYDGGFQVLIDRHDVHEGEEWKKRLGALIVAADTVVFVLSPKSAASPICRWEIGHARELSKRIIPVQATNLDGVAVPEALASLNYVRFDDRSFMSGLTALRRALKTDIAWLRDHTRLLMRAEEWQAAERAPNRLLSGQDIAAAKSWMERTPADGLTPTELHRDYIQASDQAEVLRLSAEHERADRLQRAVTRTRITLACVGLMTVVAVGLGAYAWTLKGRADTAAELARGQEIEAKSQKEAAERLRKIADEQKAIAEKESKRADRFVDLVNKDPAGRRALDKICLEAISVTSTLATTKDRPLREQSSLRFWELYYSSMYIVELHQRKTSGHDISPIETGMIVYGRKLRAMELAGEPLPNTALCPFANTVWGECGKYLNLTAPEPCQ